MKANTTRGHRRASMNAIGSEKFDSAADYFFFIHMNDRLRLVHAVSFLVALVLFVISIIKLSLILFVIQYLVSTIPAVLSHYICDGHVNRGPILRPAQSLRLGMRSNFKYLSGKIKSEEEEFLKKYSFVRSVYERQIG